MRIDCPYCGNLLELQDGVSLAQGQHVLCPFCNQKFVYDERPRRESASEERLNCSPRAFETQETKRRKRERERAMKITCPNCREVCETEQSLQVGQCVVCPFCNVKFVYGEGPVVLNKVKKFNWKKFWIIMLIIWVVGKILLLLEN